MKKSIIHCIACLLALLFLVKGGNAQTDNEAMQRAGSFGWLNGNEKLFMHTDKSFYMAGEILWFKLYAIDAEKQVPLDFSKIAYVELLNQEHRPVLQAKIALNRGMGNGSFQLPYSVSSSHYILRAYTNWMKNAGAECFFEKTLTIVNTLKKPDWTANESISYDVRFFPEGGNLVKGISSVVGYKVVDSDGKGQRASGVILNQRNDTITHFQTNRLGMGHLEFKPNGIDQYRALITVQGTQLIRPLPDALPAGMVVRLKEKDNDSILLRMETGAALNTSITLLIQGRRLTNERTRLQLINGIGEIVLPKTKLADGISRLTLLDDLSRPVCERLYCKQPPSLSLTAGTNGQSFGLRKKVEVSITSQTRRQQPVQAELSAAVYLLDSLQTPDKTDILSYLWLSSDLKGKIEDPGYYFANTDKETLAALDDLMLTQGWRRFKWVDTARGNTVMPEYMPELEGHIVNGRVMTRIGNQAGSHITAYLSVPGERPLFSIANSTDKGVIRFNLKDFYGANEMVVQTNGTSDSGYRVDIANPFWDKPSDTRVPPLVLSAEYASLLLQHNRQAQLAHTFAGDRQRQFLFPEALDTTAFYGLSDKRYYLDDYTRFITMEEVMKELIAEVRLRKNGSQFSYRMYNRAFNDYFTTDPLVLIDGVPVFNVNKLIEFDPLKIRRIDVVAQKFYQNQTIHDGIIQYHTYMGDLAGYQLDDNALIVDYEGLQLQREFYSPLYDTPDRYQSRLPDPRNVLFWSPDVKTDGKGTGIFSFFTSDNPGRYLVVVQGISGDGLAGSTATTFTVK